MIGSAVTHSAAHEASLRLTSRTDRGGYVITTLSGELGTASAPALREQLLSLLRSASHLIIDLSAVEHADAGGLAVLGGPSPCQRLARREMRPDTVATAELHGGRPMQTITDEGRRSIVLERCRPILR
jgi:ABC-type transporter Mla MlaB component